MGQKTNPIGIRLGYSKEWKSIWYSDSKGFSDKLLADIKVRDYLTKELANASVSEIIIERPADSAKITVKSARPGVIIGKKGGDVDRLKNAISKMIKVPVHLNIVEVRRPEVDAQIVADGIASQLERRVMFRRAMKRAIANAMKAGALGIKVSVSGRLGGAEIARAEWAKEGRIPLHTFRADIHYATSEANTTYGIIGVKVWIYKGNFDRIEKNTDQKNKPLGNK